jgi:isopentenyl-diphosphate delta-isomerase
VILVDENDRPLGSDAKLAVHRDGRLHRAFSVFVFDEAGRVLLQRRARAKYHSGGKWANTCCGHPEPQTDILEAAARRLQEEMGFRCPLHEVGRFTYRADLDGGLIEHEVDHVLVGQTTLTPRPDPREVEAWRWTSLAELQRDLAAAPERFVVWLPPALALAADAREALDR